MARKPMTLDQIKASRPYVDLAKVDATTEADVRRHMVEDGYDPDETVEPKDIISPAFIRRRLGMTQKQFADAIHVPPG